MYFFMNKKKILFFPVSFISIQLKLFKKLYINFKDASIGVLANKFSIKKYMNTS